MYPYNGWMLKRLAEEQINSRLREAETGRLARLAAGSSRQGHLVQHFLASLGKSLSRAGDYLQEHFGSDSQIEMDRYPAGKLSRNQPGAEIPC